MTFVFLDKELDRCWSYLAKDHISLDFAKQIYSGSYHIFPANLTIQNVWKL